jgi:hypothetical protein
MDPMLDPDTAWNFTNKDTGEMKYTQQYRGQLTVEPNLTHFPFDSLIVDISIVPRFSGIDKIVLVPDEKYVPVDVVHRMSDWMVDKRGTACARVFEPYPKVKRSNVVFTLFMRRRYKYYIYKIMSICAILVSWSWVVFWMDYTEFGDRMTILLTLFLAAVAFLISIDDNLPKVDYLTTMDKMLLYSMLMIFLAAVESFSCLVMGQASGYADAIDTLERVCRYVFPLAFLLVFGSMIAVGVRRSRHCPSAALMTTGSMLRNLLPGAPTPRPSAYAPLN